MGGWSDLGKSILRGTVTRETRGIKEDFKDGIQSTVREGAARIFDGDQQPNGARPGARPQSPPAAGAATGVNAATQEFLNRFGNNGQQQAPGLLETLTSAPGRIWDSIKPSDQNMNKLRNGAAALGAAATTAIASGSALVQDGVDSARDAASTTAAAITETVSRQRPEIELQEPAKPVATAQQIEAATAQQRPVIEVQEPAAAPETTVSTAPAVATPVKPTTEFTAAATATVAAAAAPVKPSVTANLDSMIDNEKDASRLETLTRARAQIQANYGGPSNG